MLAVPVADPWAATVMVPSRGTVGRRRAAARGLLPGSFGAGGVGVGSEGGGGGGGWFGGGGGILGGGGGGGGYTTPIALSRALQPAVQSGDGRGTKARS